MEDPRLSMILGHFDPPAGAKLWHGGASALGAIRGVGPEEAAWRPAPGRHSIWALTLHTAYWNYAVWRRVSGGARGGFPRSPSNWPDPPEVVAAASWKEDRALLRRYHGLLRETMAELDPALLDEPSGGRSGYTYADLLMGIVLHDTYHAGQIQMLKRLYASRRGG